MSLEEWLPKWPLSEAFHESESSLAAPLRDEHGVTHAKNKDDEMRKQELINCAVIRVPQDKKQTHSWRLKGTDTMTSFDTKAFHIMSSKAGSQNLV